MRLFLCWLSDKRGFSLIEVLAALTILTIGGLVLATTFGRSIASNTAAAQRTVAVQLAQAKMEGLKTMGFDAIGPATDPPITVNHVDYIRTVETLARADGSTILKNITVTVTWAQGQQVQLYTVMHK